MAYYNYILNNKFNEHKKKSKVSFNDLIMKLITDNNEPDVECFYLNLSSFFSLKLNLLIIIY